MRLPWVATAEGYKALTFRGHIELTPEERAGVAGWAVRGLGRSWGWTKELTKAITDCEAIAERKLKEARWDFPLKSGR